MTKARSLSQVNKEIQKSFPTVALTKGNGYFYIYGLDEQTSLAISSLYSQSIPVAHLNQQTVETWVSDVEDLVKELDIEKI